MIVKQTKDIEATEAKVMYGLSLKKIAIVAFSGTLAIAGVFTLHLPVMVSGILAGIVLFLGFYKKQGMSAPKLIMRWLSIYFNKQEYQAEPIARTRNLTEKEQQKAALAWNRELRRQKRRHAAAATIQTVRCTRNKKSRK